MLVIEEGANTSPRATTQGLKFSSAEYSAEGFLKILELVTDIQTSMYNINASDTMNNNWSRLPGMGDSQHYK